MEWDRFRLSHGRFISWIFIWWVRLELLGFIRCRGWAADFGQTGSLFSWLVSEWHFHLALQLSSLCTCSSSLHFSLTQDVSETVTHPLQENQREGQQSSNLVCAQRVEQKLSQLLFQPGFHQKKSLRPGSIFQRQYWNLLGNQSKQMLGFILDIARSWFFISWDIKSESMQSVSDIKHPHCIPCSCIQTQPTSTQDMNTQQKCDQWQSVTGKQLLIQPSIPLLGSQFGTCPSFR